VFLRDSVSPWRKFSVEVPGTGPEEFGGRGKITSAQIYFCNLTSDLCNPMTPMTWKERERAFFVGAPLAILPALGFLPAVVFLVVVPRVAHAGTLACIVLPVFGLAGGFGLWKLALGAVERPFNVLNALSFGALLALLIIAAYTGMFLALFAARL
jgi:hypothetical protein